ncbi:hypothetical protein ASE01_21765 [Nocardioides sp. Root190]|uniref:hypothetical protein n=1 Tax=Nocardioides sp. Root190 TaxID=1736488 RepID=UPI000701F596|nr:hypothetical protein [Nocardioides sp. Root190]KRB72687.1 hypothetical protein ASE01_21765 [Nocardioides sp. Root190]
MASDSVQQHPLNWARGCWILWLLVAAFLWILITGREALWLDFPRGPAALMLVVIGGIAFNSWRQDVLGKRPLLAITVTSVVAFVAALVVGVAVV